MPFALLNTYIRYLISSSGKPLFIGFCLLLLVAVTEGVSLFMLLPLLSVLTGDSSVTEKLPALFRDLPQQFNPAAMLLIFFILLCLRAAAIFIRENYITLIRLQASDRLRADLFSAMLQCQWQDSSVISHDQSVEQLTAGIQRVGMATFYLLKITTSLILLLTYLVIALKLAPVAVLLALLSGGVTLFLLRGINRTALSMGEGLSQTNRQLYNRVLFYLNGLKSIKAFQREAEQVSLFEQQQDQLRQNQLSYQRKSGRNQFLFSTVTAAVVCLMAYGGLFWLELTLATMMLLLVIFVRLMPMLADMQNNLQRLLHTLPAFTDIITSLQRLRQGAEPRPSTASLPVPREQISLEGASYLYPSGRGFQDLTLHLPVGKVTLLRGASGSGKTTVADILSGLLTLQQGKLCVDDVVLTAAELSAWRGQVVYITQEPFLFDATVRENILWGRQLTDPQLMEVCQRAAADFISELPQGLDTRIGERGISLSGGQRQRIILARALCRKPALLILDEASNALDPETEQQWLANVQQLTPGLSVLLISHRQDAALWADHIIDLNQESTNGN